MSNYGKCFVCGSEVVSRTRGIPSYDTCEKGHRGLASITLTHELAATVDNGQARFATLETQLAAADRLAEAAAQLQVAAERVAAAFARKGGEGFAVKELGTAIMTGRVALAAYRAIRGGGNGAI